MTPEEPEVQPEAAPAAPVPVVERIRELDVLRGFALFGIIAANMRGFNSPAPVYFNLLLLWREIPDRVAQAVIDCFISGKFITIFSLLFGVGFAIQLSRARERGQSLGFYSRRMGMLVVFGLAHAFLLWWGDILLAYAVTGFALLLFRNRAQRTVLIWALGLYLLPLFLMFGFYGVMLAGVRIQLPPEPTAEQLQETIRIYSQGSFGEIFVVRAKEWATLNAGFLFYVPRVLGLFLMGFYVWRTGILENIAAHERLFRRALWWGLAVGLPTNAAVVVLTWIYNPNPMVPSGAGMAIWTASSLGIPFLSLFYICAVILLFQRDRWRRPLMAFSFVGRMALTNYLLQTVLCTLLFYSFGIGLFGKVGPLAGLIPTFVIYGLQIPLSVAWLARLRYGPMEWLWRRATYVSLPGMRVGRAG